MKKLNFTVLLVLFASFAFAQTPQAFSYQAVARNASGNVIANQAISVRLSILDASASGTVQYSELHTDTTNEFGLFTLTVGKPKSVVSGTFAGVSWATGKKFMKVELDATGGSTFVLMGTTELLSVPYAMYAGRANVNASFIKPPGCTKLDSVKTTLTKIGDMGTFTKQDAGTLIELNLQTSFYALLSNANGIVYELRVDGAATTVGNATLLYRSSGVNLPGAITGVYLGLAAGSHTVSLWARAAGGGGAAKDIYWDPGCFNNTGTNNILVKEY